MKCPNCGASLDKDAAFCGNCGQQLTPLSAPGATIAEGTQLMEPTSNIGQNRARTSYPQASDERTVMSGSESNGNNNLRSGPGVATPPSLSYIAPPATRPGRNNTRLIVFVALILVLLVAGVSAGIVALSHNNKTATTNNGGGSTATTQGAAGSVTGTASFSDSQAGQAQTDTIKVIANNLSAPPSGSQYDAWLINEDSEQITALGKLTAAGTSFSINFTQHGGNLVGAGNKIEITQEQGDVTVPSGKILLAGTLPAKALVHIRHLLFKFPTTPNNVGLVVGMRDQAQKLNSEAGLLQSFFASNNTTAIQCAAQAIVNIDEGKQGAHYQVLQDACKSFSIVDLSDGFGILNYASTARQHAALAANSSDATDNIKTHATHVEISTQDVTNWVTTIEQNALSLLTDANDGGKVQKIVKFAGQVLNGVPDADGVVNPVPDHAGTLTAYAHAQFMALLPLVAP